MKNNIVYCYITNLLHLVIIKHILLNKHKKKDWDIACH